MHPHHGDHSSSDDPAFFHEQHKADWDKHGKAAGFIRNKQMLDSGVHLVCAFSEWPLTRGTGNMVDIAKKTGVPVRVFSHG